MATAKAGRQARDAEEESLSVGGAGGADEGDMSGDMTPAELAELELEEALSEIPSQARASLTWLDPKSAQWVYLCQLTPDQVRREFVRENFGGGRFKGRFRNGKAWGRTFEFIIDPAIPRRVPAWLMADVTPAPTAAAAPVAPSSGAALPDGVSMDKLLMSEMMELMRAGRDQRAAAADASTAMMTAVMGMVRSMSESTAALVTSIAGARGTRQEFGIADVLKLLEHRQPTAEITALLEQAKRRSGGDDLGAIEKALGLIDRLRGKVRRDQDHEDDDDGDGGDPLIGAVRQLLPPILKALTGEPVGAPRPAPGTRPTATVRVAGAAAPASAPTDAAPSEPAEPAAQPVPSFLDVAYTSVLEAAQEGQDPREFAVSLLQMTPRIFRGRVREFVVQPDAAAQVVAQYPDMQPYAAWIGECIAGLREEFNPPPDDEPAAPPAGG